MDAYNKKLDIIVTYYNDGFLHSHNGTIKNISTVYRCVEFTDSRVIPYADIMDTKII
ncbi:YolD-like family protein [Ectobacillus polymachus]|uniref:YolD-like family protein n=1 Tax=Ectobacillus polymachus TaxID=1508806 RepID=UPI003A89E6E4